MQEVKSGDGERVYSFRMKASEFERLKLFFNGKNTSETIQKALLKSLQQSNREKELRDLNSQVELKSRNEISKLKTEIEKLKSENAKLQKELNSTSALLNHYEVEIEKIVNSNDDFSHENFVLKEQLAQKDKEIKQINFILQQERNEKISYQNHYNSLFDLAIQKTQEVKDLQEQLKFIKNKMEQ